MEKQDLRLVYVYDSNGTLVNGKPFVGAIQAANYLESKDISLEDNIYESEVMQIYFVKMILGCCHTNGEKTFGYYFRTRPTTVFKSRVKFYNLKLKA
jgi:hypothetical protein